MKGDHDRRVREHLADVARRYPESLERLADGGSARDGDEAADELEDAAIAVLLCGRLEHAGGDRMSAAEFLAGIGMAAHSAELPGH
jgi:hypothetical protein